MFIMYITSHHDVHYKHHYNIYYHTHTHILQMSLKTNLKWLVEKHKLSTVMVYILYCYGLPTLLSCLYTLLLLAVL